MVLFIGHYSKNYIYIYERLIDLFLKSLATYMQQASDSTIMKPFRLRFINHTLIILNHLIQLNQDQDQD